MNAACKRAWGESVAIDSFDPGSLVDELRPAITDALGAAGDRDAVASTLLDLYRRYAGSDSDAVSRIFQACLWTGSSTLRAACDKAIQEAGPAVVEVLRGALGDETDEDAAVGFLFDECQSAVDAIRPLANRVEALRNAYRRAVRVTDDSDVLDALADGLRAADQHRGHQAAEILFEYYRDEAALGMSGDPWPLLEELIESLQEHHAGVGSEEEALDVLMRTLRRAIAGEGASSLWEGYQHLLDERDEFGGLVNAEALLEAHARLIRSGPDSQWLVDELCEVCFDIAHSNDDVSYLLPDRLQVSNACIATIRMVMAPADGRDELLRAFQFAVPRCGDPWGVLSKACRKILVTADGKTESVIADILAARGSSSDDGIDHLMSTYENALSALKDPEVETELLYEAYVDAILDDNDPGDAVETLVHGARRAIAKADDPEAAIRLFLEGLSVETTGWPPRTPAWLTPE
ncbi:MAG: hypothetical protein F4X60_00725 [Gemmatimonadetes bacterium]|nr:hypothetical protein [Gemmatimonadota bacterium]MYB97068.1 hypothetical protein [Gemmatimonadota bacterium]